jgi:regulatory protein
MNDIISLDAARRERSSRSGHPSRGSRAGAARGPSGSLGDSDDSEFDEPELSDEERLSRVSDTVVRALGRRQLSAGETRELLVAQGATSVEADELVQRYEELGYLNDSALAEALVEKLSERSHKSRGIIARELSARKIPAELVTVALENLDDDHEFTLALDAATKRVTQLSAYDEQTVERRLVGFLTRRGFSSGIVREATRRAMSTRKTFGGPRFR